MESQKPKVAMYVKRSFGEKLNASFNFNNSFQFSFMKSKEAFNF